MQKTLVYAHPIADCALLAAACFCLEIAAALVVHHVRAAGASAAPLQC